MSLSPNPQIKLGYCPASASSFFRGVLGCSGGPVTGGGGGQLSQKTGRFSHLPEAVKTTTPPAPKEEQRRKMVTKIHRVAFNWGQGGLWVPPGGLWVLLGGLWVPPRGEQAPPGEVAGVPEGLRRLVGSSRPPRAASRSVAEWGRGGQGGARRQFGGVTSVPRDPPLAVTKAPHLDVRL